MMPREEMHLHYVRNVYRICRAPYVDVEHWLNVPRLFKIYEFRSTDTGALDIWVAMSGSGCTGCW